MRVMFNVHKANRVVKFHCPHCKKDNRQRKIDTYQTVNPYNKDAHGIPYNDEQVARNVQLAIVDLVKTFLNSPVCASCERNMTWKEMEKVHEARKIHV